MIRVQPLAGQRSFRRACWAVAALAVAAGASACASGSYSASSPPSSASGPPSSAVASSAVASSAVASSTAASGSRPATTPATAGGSSAGADAALDRTRPAPVLADWLHQLVVADYHAACRDMGEPASAGTAASPAPAPGACPSSDTVTALKSFHGNFVADGLKPGSRFTIATPKTAGASLTVNGTVIKVSGSNLTALMTAHSTGVKPGELKLSFTLSAIGGRWYVSDLNLDV